VVFVWWNSAVACNTETTPQLESRRWRGGKSREGKGGGRRRGGGKRGVGKRR
jgi:hypothetical protein